MTETIRTQGTILATSQYSVPAIPAERANTACCGGPASAGTDACCARDEDAKSAGAAGCGCGPVPTAPARTVAKTGCCG